MNLGKKNFHRWIRLQDNSFNFKISSCFLVCSDDSISSSLLNKFLYCKVSIRRKEKEWNSPSPSEFRSPDRGFFSVSLLFFLRDPLLSLDDAIRVPLYESHRSWEKKTCLEKPFGFSGAHDGYLYVETLLPSLLFRFATFSSQPLARCLRTSR